MQKGIETHCALISSFDGMSIRNDLILIFWLDISNQRGRALDLLPSPGLEVCSCPDVIQPAGMIVPEELHKAVRNSSGQGDAETEAKPQEAISSGEQAKQQEQSTNALEMMTAVTTEEMSVGQTVSDNKGKSEGWTAELEQPKITTAVETEVLFVLQNY